MAMQNKSTIDIWGKLDVVFKSIAAILISGAITTYGIYSNKGQSEIAEANRRSQILVQTMNHRETSAAHMRAQMFNTLMQHYFKKQDNGTQIIILELIGLNFQDHLHLKPLFKRLDAKLVENSKERNALRKAASYIKRNEINQIVGSGGEVIELEFEVNETCRIEPYSIINLTLLEVEEDHIRVTADPNDDREGFEVTYYDMPFMDHSRLGEFTYSVVLSSIDQKNRKAKVKVVILPEYYYSSRNNLRFDALIGELLEKGD